MKINFLLCMFVLTGCVWAEGFVGSAKAADDVVVKGSVVFDQQRAKSWDGHPLTIPFEEIETRLFERIVLPPPPFPKGWKEMKPEEQLKWAKAFDESKAGKEFIAKRDKMIEDANAFDVKIEKDGRFVIYDVPTGVYGLQGRVDKEIEGTTYAFEVFGQIEVLKEVDEIALDPMLVEVTPLLKLELPAPPIAVETHNGKKTLSFDNFKGKYLFVNFWITDSPSAAYQEEIQAMYAELKGKYPLRLLSICVDEDRKEAVKYIVEKKLKEGSHGFTDGLDHRTIFDFGVRSIPSFWLITPDGKISMTQYEFSRMFHLGQRDLKVIVGNRIEGKDIPTPAAAEKPADADQQKQQEGEPVEAK